MKKPRPNKIAEKCRNCGVYCLPGAGFLFRDYQWYVKCKDCSKVNRPRKKKPI